MGVPAIDFGEGDLDADVGLDQLGDLLEVAAERALLHRIDGAVGGLIGAGASLLEQVEGVERFARGAVEDGVDRGAVHAFKAIGRTGGAGERDRDVAGEAESVEIADGEGILLALEGAGNGRGHADGAEGGFLGGIFGAAAEHAVEPAVGHAAVLIDARFH